jgi:hypothetical protein
MVQPNLAFLLRRGIVSHLNERHLMGLLQVSRQEGGTTRDEIIGMQPKDICIPLPRAFGVPYKYVHMPEILRFVAHGLPPLSDVRVYAGR